MAEGVALSVVVNANLDDLRAKMNDATNIVQTTEGAMKSMANAFDGAKIISNANAAMLQIQALGGAINLTAAEQAKANVVLQAGLDKYAALGKDAPAGMQALADATKGADDSVQGFSLSTLTGIPIIGQFIAAMSVERLFAFASGAVEAAGHLADLSLATGISTDGLQRMQYVGQEFGLDIDQLSRGVEQLSAKLANGDANATKAVEMLGLSVSALLAMGPEQMFLTIADAAGRIEDPMTKGGVASDLFGGKLAKVLIPALSDLRQKMADVPQTALISDENIQKAHDFDVGLAHLKDTLKATTVGMLAWIASIPKSWGQNFSAPTPPSSGGGDIQIPKDSSSGAADTTKLTNAQLWANMLDALKVKQVALTSVNVDELASEAALGVSLKDLATHYGLNETSVSSLIEAHKTFTKAVTDVNSAGQGWKGTLDSIDGSTVEAIKYYLQAGVAQGTLATYYGLTATQIKSVASEITNETAQHKLEGDAVLAVTKLWDDYTAVIASDVGSAYDKAGASIDKWYDDLIAKNQKAKTDTAAFYDAIAALDDAKWAHMTLNQLQADAATKQHADKAAADAQAAYQFALNNSDGYTDAELAHLKAVADATAFAASQWTPFGDAAVAAAGKATGALQGTVSALAAVAAATAQAEGLSQGPSGFAGGTIDMQWALPSGITDSSVLQQLAQKKADSLGLTGLTASVAYDDNGNPYVYIPGVSAAPHMGSGPGITIPARATGGPVTSGMPYMVGERGPELFVPSSSGSIVPNGGSGGGSTTIQIYVTQPLGTPSAIAAAVDQALMQRQRNTGQRMPA